MTITETNPAPIVQFSSAGETVDANTGAFSITVTLSAVSDVDATIPFTLGGTAIAGTDYTNVTAIPLVIAAGQTTGTISGALLATAPANAVKTLTFTLGTPTNAVLGDTTAYTLTIDEPPPVATSLVFLQQPSDATALQPLATDVMVQVLDQFGLPVITGDVTLAVTSGSPGDFDSASTVHAPVNADGVADFNNLIFDAAGVYSLTASYGDQINFASNDFTISAAALGFSLNGASE